MGNVIDAFISPTLVKHVAKVPHSASAGHEAFELGDVQ